MLMKTCYMFMQAMEAQITLQDAIEWVCQCIPGVKLRVIPDSLIYHGGTDFERPDHLASYRSQFPRFAMCRDLPISSDFC